MRSPSLEGACLVSQMLSSTWKGVTVLITHDEPEGTLGLIWDKPHHRRVKNYLTKGPAALLEARVYRGGPVEPQVLSLVGLALQAGQMKVKTHLSPAQASAWLKRWKTAGQVRGYIGYCGWAPGQLMGEIERGDWKAVPVTPRRLIGQAT